MQSFNLRRTSHMVFCLSALVAIGCGDDDSNISEVRIPAPKGSQISGVPSSPIVFVSQVGLSTHGFYLVDGDNARVLFADRNGRVQRSVGRHGGAPGEYRNMSTAAATVDGRMAILDLASITLLDSSGAFFKRFFVRPSLGSIRYVCHDSLLAFVPFGDVRKNSQIPVVSLYSLNGTLVREVGVWPSWSKNVNNSISQFAVTERDCRLTLMEAFGGKIGWLSLNDPKPTVTQRDVDWSGHAAEIMTVAVQTGLSPDKALTKAWTNASVWQLDGDTLLIRQDSLAPDRARFHRYLVSSAVRTARSTATDFIIWQIRDNLCVFSRHRDDGEVEIGTITLDQLLDPFRAAVSSFNRD